MSSPCTDKKAPAATGPCYTRPDYAEAFRCISSACEDTCCTGWTIPIDRRTLERYQTDPVLRPFTSLLVLNPAPTSGDAARMPLTQTGACAFLNPERLCGIQQHFGSTKLSQACNSYPRESTTRFGTLETALNLSCPEAARLTLLEPELLGAKLSQGALPDRYTEVFEQAEQLPAGFDPVLAVREFCLLLLADRTNTMPRRLQRLGTLATTLQSLARAARLEPNEWVERHPETLARILSQILARTNTRTAKSGHGAQPGLAMRPGTIPHANSIEAEQPGSDDFPRNHVAPARQLYFASAILRRRLADGPVSPRFRECLHHIEEALHLRFTEAALDGLSIEAYIAASGRYLTPFLHKHPHLLENLVTNHIFKYQYPFGRQPENSLNLVENHTFLCTQVALLQTLMVGVAGYRQDELEPGHIVTLVQTLARAIEHRRPSLDAIATFVRIHSLDTPEALDTLLQLPASALRSERRHVSLARRASFTASLWQVAC